MQRQNLERKNSKIDWQMNPKTIIPFYSGYRIKWVISRHNGAYNRQTHKWIQCFYRQLRQERSIFVRHFQWEGKNRHFSVTHRGYSSNHITNRLLIVGFNGLYFIFIIISDFHAQSAHHWWLKRTFKWFYIAMSHSLGQRNRTEMNK